MPPKQRVQQPAVPPPRARAQQAQAKPNAQPKPMPKANGSRQELLRRNTRLTEELKMAKKAVRDRDKTIDQCADHLEIMSKQMKLSTTAGKAKNEAEQAQWRGDLGNYLVAKGWSVQRSLDYAQAATCKSRPKANGFAHGFFGSLPMPHDAAPAYMRDPNEPPIPAGYVPAPQR